VNGKSRVKRHYRGDERQVVELFLNLNIDISRFEKGCQRRLLILSATASLNTTLT